jgi:hypothetical protein
MVSWVVRMLILMTGTAAAAALVITKGTSTNFSSGTNSYGSTYVGFTNNGTNGNNLTVANTNTSLSNSSSIYVGKSGYSNSMVISNGGNPDRGEDECDRPQKGEQTSARRRDYLGKGLKSSNPGMPVKSALLFVAKHRPWQSAVAAMMESPSLILSA